MNQNLNRKYKDYLQSTGEKISFKDFVKKQVENGIIPDKNMPSEFLSIEGTKKVNSIRIFGLKPIHLGLIVVGTIGITMLVKIAYKKYVK